MGKKTAAPAVERAKAELVQSELLPLSLIENNTGQITGVPYNPRRIDTIKFAKLKASIEEHPRLLSLRELMVYKFNGKYVVIGGNMRLRALRELKYKEAVCKVIPEDTPIEDLPAYIIKDNDEFGEWDMDALADLFDRADLDRWGIELPEIDTEAEEDAKDDGYDGSTPKVAKTKEGDIYQLGRHRLICGDSTDPVTLQLLLGSDKADLLLTDPPYNVDYSSKNEALNAVDKGNRVQRDIENDKMEDGRFQEFLTDAFRNAIDALKPGGAFYIWHADSQGYNFRMAAARAGLQIRQVLIWNKNNMVLGRQDYQWKHEPCLYGWKDGAGHYFADRRDLLTVLDEFEKDEAPDLGKMTKAELQDLLEKILKLPATVIDENKPQRSADHPTMKPVKLMGRLIKNSTRPGEIVLDTFAGSGSTLIAADQLGRRCFSVELDPIYCDVIIKRWQEQSGEIARLLGNFKNSEAKNE